MRSTARFGSTTGRHRLLKGGLATGIAILLCTAIGGAASASAAQPRNASHPAATGTVIDEVTGPYGPMLVAGSGPGAGTALYAISSDYGTHFGCTTAVVTVLGGPAQCTGPESDTNVEWPALTTAAAPVAGPGVNSKLLGEVNRSGIGEQVTYNGHPLYLFDSIPGVPTGEAWDEATLPPWHGVWELVEPSGVFLPPAGTLTTTKTSNGTTVLGAVMTAGGGSVAFPLYTLNGASSCPGSCIESWIPLITAGTSGVLRGVSSALLGTVTLPDGSSQLTYGGKALYLYGNEAISFATGFPLAEGNGNGMAAPSPATGTFELATLAATPAPSHQTRVVSHRAASGGTVIDEAVGAFGPMLVVGSGPAAGTALYAISSDYGTHFGCSAAVVTVRGKPRQCTGPETDTNAEWPALTTTAAPVAGPGVNPKLLNEVNRPGIGKQVTYAGHPLYLFDSIPGILTGEGWDEATLPPWHGVWSLVFPSGIFQAPAGTLTTTKTAGGKTVLAAIMTVGGGSFAFPLYDLNGAASCPGSCIENWIPLLTAGTPGLLNGVSAKLLGSVQLPNGSRQVTYAGKPLYLYGNEGVSLATGFPAAEGNGNGVAAPAPVKGTFELATA